MFHFYNTLTRSKEPFTPIVPGTVGIYACGPTVYWFAHIGNMRAFLFADVLRRALELEGMDVKFVMNITDVGHLTDDGDAGEDKMLVAMRREGKSAYEIAAFYTEAFLKDLERLHIEPASALTRATEHIPEQIAMIEEIERNGLAYRTSDGMYFDTSKLPAYGQLSGQASSEKLAGARVDMGEKRHATDFALWKFSYPNGRSFDGAQDDTASQRQMEWESPWGKGFPGWHIECSAMSKKYLGVPFDIHTGGIDHIPVHHENEIAQTLGADGVLEANVWMHAEFLIMHGGKMSKSLGNLFTLQDLVDKGYDPIAYRYLVLQAHYRTKLDFSFEALEAAQNALHRLRNVVRDWDAPVDTGCAEYEVRFFGALQDDLNTSQALAVAWEMVGDDGQPSAARGHALLRFDRVLGLGLDAYVSRPLEIPRAVRALADLREQARAAHDFAEADRLRAEILSRGFVVEDATDGWKIRAA
ncbi:cysteine--tRNA ligase [Candidatus Uhrbacteria bacterium]|nr:cysteine--tRNA ligase [Candidatus Uhrbacteria bacterium]